MQGPMAPVVVTDTSRRPGLSVLLRRCMPNRPFRPCRYPGCPRLTSGGYCMEHAQGSARTGRARDAARGSAARRGYGGEWRAVRAAVLLHEPQCRACGGRATEVDHIVPLRLGGTHALANLQPLCASCHRRKTASQQPGAGRKSTIMSMPQPAPSHNSRARDQTNRGPL